MIQATGNNFGCGPIQIKDCLDGDMLILNTVITFSPESDEYKAADVLEIYVPDLPLKRSAENGVFLTSYQIKSPGHWDESKRYIATVVRSWIKDKNTICIEKLPIYDELVPDTVYIERPQIIERVETLDTISVLKNKYAVSEASVSGIVLRHSLEVKPIKEPVKVESRVEYRDSMQVNENK